MRVERVENVAVGEQLLRANVSIVVDDAPLKASHVRSEQLLARRRHRLLFTLLWPLPTRAAHQHVAYH